MSAPATPEPAPAHGGDSLTARWQEVLRRDPHLGLFERNLDTGQGWWDETLRRAWGLQPGEPVPGLAELQAALLPVDQVLYRARLSRPAQPGDVDGGDFRFIDRRGQLRVLRCFWRISQLADGTRVVTGTAHDITASVQAQAQSLAREAQLSQARQLALDVASIGSWEWSAETRRVRFDATLLAVHGWSGQPAELPETQWLQAIHPGDRDRLLPRWRAATAGSSGRGTTRFRIVRPDGQVRHLRLAVAPLPSAGPVRGLQGVCLDETDTLALERRLRDEREVLAAAERLAQVGSWRRPLDGGAPYWSPQVYAIFGCDPAQPVPAGDAMGAFFPDGGWERLWLADEQQQRDGRPFTLELPLRRADGSRGWVRAWNELELDDDGRPLARRGSVQDISSLVAVRERAEQGDHRMRELALRQQEDFDRLRAELARDLHDQLGQTLSALKLELDLLARPQGGGLPRLRALLDEAVNTVRDISRELRPPALELGLLPALHAHAADLSMRSDIDVALHLPPALPPLPAAVTTGLYRIAQEALNNVTRHARAREVLLQVQLGPDRLQLTVRDDGRGFDAGHALTGLGLLGMRERAQQIGAKLLLDSAPGRGTRLEVTWPLPAPAAAATTGAGDGPHAGGGADSA